MLEALHNSIVTVVYRPNSRAAALMHKKTRTGQKGVLELNSSFSR